MRKKKSAKKPRVEIPQEILDGVPEELRALVDRVPPEAVLVGGVVMGTVRAMFALLERGVVALEKIAKEVALPGRTEH
jgi:hypothetical protein